MPFREFKDDQKQFLGLQITCKQNKDGSHNEENVLRVLDKLRHHSKLENTSSVSDSKKDNYIATGVKCFENEVEEHLKIIREIEEIENVTVSDHLSLIELNQLVEKLEKS